MSQQLEFVGTWDEISQHAALLQGLTLRVTVVYDTGHNGKGVRADATEAGAGRLPDLPLESKEGPPPIEIPRPDGGEVVSNQIGALRLPDPPILWSERR